jgi:hypothetical protein
VSALSKRAAEVEARFGSEAAAAWRKYHVTAQLTRLIAGMVSAVVLAALHGVSDWTDLAPVAVAALWATLEQMWPQVPWKLVLNRFGAQKPLPATGGYITWSASSTPAPTPPTAPPGSVPPA